MALAQIAQQDFSAGMVRSVAPHLIPANGAYKLQNMLVSPDGSPYRRGGTSYKSNAAFGTGLRFVWDGYLVGGRRTVVASTADFGVLAADDTTVVNLGGDGLANPVHPAVLDGILYMGRTVYAGSRLTASYSTGTVSVTNGSATVTGSGTTWSTNVDAGMLVAVAGGALYAVKTVDSDTQLTLERNYTGASGTGQAYTASPVASMPGTYPSGEIVAALHRRLVICTGNRAYFSASGDAGSWNQTENYHELPGGVEIRGADATGGTLLLFTTGGLWTVSGLAYDLTDDYGNVNHQVAEANRDLVLWDAAGIAGWQDNLIVPAHDGVWLLGEGGPQILSRSITPYYTAYVRAGYTPGGAAVHQGHYFLPVLSGSGVVDMLVCRVDRPVETGWAWTNWTGAGGELAALTRRSRPGEAPVLFGADYSSRARLVTMPALEPDATYATDHDGVPPAWDLVTRDFATGQLNRNHVRKARVRYELVAGGDAAEIEGSFASDFRPATTQWGQFSWGEAPWVDSGEVGFAALSGAAPEDEGDDPFQWNINKRTRFARLRLTSSDAATRAVVRSVEWFVRQSAKM